MSQCHPAFSNEEEVIFVLEREDSNTSALKTSYIDPDEVKVEKDFDEIVDGEQQLEEDQGDHSSQVYHKNSAFSPPCGLQLVEEEFDDSNIIKGPPQQRQSLPKQVPIETPKRTLDEDTVSPKSLDTPNSVSSSSYSDDDDGSPTTRTIILDGPFKQPMSTPSSSDAPEDEDDDILDIFGNDELYEYDNNQMESDEFLEGNITSSLTPPRVPTPQQQVVQPSNRIVTPQQRPAVPSEIAPVVTEPPLLPNPLQLQPPPNPALVKNNNHNVKSIKQSSGSQNNVDEPAALDQHHQASKSFATRADGSASQKKRSRTNHELKRLYQDEGAARILNEMAHSGTKRRSTTNQANQHQQAPSAAAVLPSKPSPMRPPKPSLSNDEQPKKSGKAAEFECETCDKVLKTRTGYRQHVLTHQPDSKNYTCKVCLKSFRQDSHLKTHSRTHTGERPFTCDQCGRSFSHSSTLYEHENLHKSVKPYKCGRCQLKFAQKKTLKTHLCHRPEDLLDPVDGELTARVKCPFCPRYFRNRKGLDVHKKNAHGEKSSEPLQ